MNPMMADNKKMASMILSESDGKEMKDKETEYDDNYGLEIATKEVMQALESKNVTALKDALKGFIELCKENDEYEKEEAQGEVSEDYS